jgi:hypothetical protein
MLLEKLLDVLIGGGTVDELCHGEFDQLQQFGAVPQT